MGRLIARGSWSAPFTTVLEDGRGHRIEVDLTREEGGSDRSTSSLELAVLSLAGCITTIFAIVARKRRLPFEALSIDLEADRPPRSRTVTAIRGTVTVTTSAPEADVGTAVEVTVRTCPVGVLFHGAGIPVEVRTVVRRPAGPAASGSEVAARPAVGATG